MHFCSTFLNLIFWASLLLAAGAIPYDRSKRGVYQSDPDLGTSALRHSVVPRLQLRSSETHSLERRKEAGAAAQEFANEWFGQLHHEDWIDYSFNSKCVGYDKNEETFMRNNLTTEVADRKLLASFGSYNKGIFTLPNLKDSVVKLVRLTGLCHETASCEIESLKAFGQQVTSGFATLPEGNVGVIIMKKVEGIYFSESSKWMFTLDEAQKLNALDALKQEVQEMIYNLLREGKPLFSDFQDGNILIDEEEKAHLVDFGFPGVWPVKMVPERNVFNKWFERRWYFLWESSYQQLGYPVPVFYQEPISKKKNKWSTSILTKLGLGRSKRKGKRGSFAIDSE
ncbi:hypothetical protein C8R41DRAFT_493851 [Lentinula lateritia]|uniref:Protein kinase domain-containing protein n=1 Tax=Lentinula lateritia TaxID=40482 RepID=A0ABQ8VBF8_9AGAR|nr:hypothetical protein C8R41DRAFT_493851 [Lentinula lateritia]